MSDLRQLTPTRVERKARKWEARAARLRSRAEKRTPIVVPPKGVYGVASDVVPLDQLPRYHRASARAARTRVRAWDRERRRHDAPLLHPRRTWFRRLWTRNGRALIRRRRDLVRRVAAARAKLVSIDYEEYRQTQTAKLHARFAEWEAKDEDRIRRQTFNDFRLLQPSLTNEEILSRIHAHFDDLEEMPVERVAENGKEAYAGKDTS